MPDPRRPPQPPPAAQAALDRYRPALAGDAHAALVKGLAAWYLPKNRADADRAAQALSGLVYWADSTGRPVDPDVLLDLDVIEQYLGSLDTLAVLAVKAYRTTLKRVARNRAGRPGRRTYGPDPAHGEPPYATDEVDALLVWAQHQPSPKRSHALLAVLVLGLGAGLSNADLTVVRGTDVTRDPATGAVLVDVRRTGAARAVPVLARYEDEALRLAAVAGDGWVVNPDVDPHTNTRPEAALGSQVSKAPAPTGAPGLTISRCRTTWLCHHLLAGTRVDLVAAAGGYKNAPAAVDAAKFLKPIDPEDAKRALRGAVVLPAEH